ncbi:dermonecrotic toxin domain-containing protein [Pseudomonas alkylphenolica]|uniref:dermonecrotic toxin domain-containing protein n=1 Tax=Pseudomonas alkylphenolica TaxID=237609 RepID=UPI0018D7059C|nr:DUF6543 domain-containing protein [Pseudomonas alkylphenolica]MBH3427724.1 mannosyltransferase [Pseudomonas alkylphenolica]
MLQTYVNAAGVQFVRDLLKHVPRPDREAARCIGEWAGTQGLQLDPEQTDVVTLHYRGQEAVIVNRMSLTQALVSNWQGESNKDLIGSLFPGHWAGYFPKDTLKIVNALPEHSVLDNSAAYSVFNGLFRRSDPVQIDATTHLPVDVEALQRYIWNLDFHAHYKKLLDQYWAQHLQDHRLAAKINFIAACNKQSLQRSLSDGGRSLCWQAAGLEKRSPGLRVRPLNIYGYAASDIICIADSAGPSALLYIPGNSAPLHEFSDMNAMKDWIGLQCQDADKRQALRQHFHLADTPDGLDFSGLDTALDGLGAYPAIHWRSPNRAGFTTDGPWSPRDYVNYRPTTYSRSIKGDLFEALSQRQRERSYADADFIITSDSEVTKAKWRGYLTTSINLLGPLALVVPELAPLFALVGISQFSLGLDQAINGKSLNAKADGVTTLEFGLLNALPLALEAGAKVPALFDIRGEGFVLPTRVNEQWGYPLSPVSPPHLPEIEAAEFFVLDDSIAPLPGGDPAVAASVIRQPLYTGEPDQLQTTVGGYGINVVYDLERDAFVTEDDLNEVMPTFYVAREGRRELVTVNAMERPVTNQMRMNTLRSLGVDLPLPVEIPVLDPATLQAIPKKISSIWVGDKVISSKLLENIAGNAQRLSSSDYELRLFLSNTTPTAFEANTRLLAEHAPGLTVLTLEEQPFYQAFSESDNFSQYRHAIDGNGGVACNFSSASDVLRYPLLEHEGGLYMDIDDTLLAAHEDPLRDPSQGAPADVAAIDTVPLLTTPEGLLLHQPMSNQKMGMNWEYNTSLIGSHPGNPTLRLISDEMRARYLADTSFYDSKPSLADNPQGFYRYAERLSRLTGPRLLTDVVEQHLPGLHKLRQVFNLLAMNQVNIWTFIPRDAFKLAWREQLPLVRIANVGGNHSWTTT